MCWDLRLVRDRCCTLAVWFGHEGALRLVGQWTKTSSEERQKKQQTAMLGNGRRLWAVDGDVGLDVNFGLDDDFRVAGNAGQ
jgi:hypothetical protein